ncbi:MAG: hypothetical protein LCI00_14515 [Chloroflexi bacterium]|nr:hypothetical protein [Chloroflexota bacterium]
MAKTALIIGDNGENAVDSATVSAEIAVIMAKGLPPPRLPISSFKSQVTRFKFPEKAEKYSLTAKSPRTPRKYKAIVHIYTLIVEQVFDLCQATTNLCK